MMFMKLWRHWLSNPREPIPLEPPIFENAAHDELETIIISAFHNEKACFMYDESRRRPNLHEPRDYRDRIPDTMPRPAYPMLTPDASRWMEENTPGYVARPSRAANFLMDVTFKSATDAVKFKLFWP